MNTYFEHIQNNMEDVLDILKKDEALCNMLVDMINNKCNTSDWHDERILARLTDHKHPYYNLIPDNNNDSLIPEYMLDFYNETILSNQWTSLSNDEKLKKLDNDLDIYFSNSNQQI